MPVAIGISISSLILSGGIAYGVVKVTTSRNSKDIDKLLVIATTKDNCKVLRDGCQALLLSKIEEVKTEQTEFKREIKATLKDYDDKRNLARNESQKTLEKIHNFMGRVDEYIRIKNGNN